MCTEGGQGFSEGFLALESDCSTVNADTRINSQWPCLSRPSAQKPDDQRIVANLTFKAVGPHVC